MSVILSRRICLVRSMILGPGCSTAVLLLSCSCPAKVSPGQLQCPVASPPVRLNAVRATCPHVVLLNARSSVECDAMVLCHGSCP